MPPRTIQKVLGIDAEYTRSVDPGRTDKAPPVEVRPSSPPPSKEAPKPPAEARPVVEPTPAAAPVKPPRSMARPPDGSSLEVPARSRKGSKKDEARTERVATWVRPLQAQADRIAATGLPIQHVLKAAWRKAAPRCDLGPGYVAPVQANRAEGDEYRYASSLRLDADTLTALSRAEDRLGIMSRWALVRGQVEPLFWQALDELLDRIEAEAGEQGREAP